MVMGFQNQRKMGSCGCSANIVSYYFWNIDFEESQYVFMYVCATVDTHYTPQSVVDLRHWLGDPAIYVLDCSAAGVLLPSLIEGVHPSPAGIDLSSSSIPNSNNNNSMMDMQHHVNSLLSRSGSLSSMAGSNVSLPSMAGGGGGAVPITGLPINKRGGSSLSDFQYAATNISGAMDATIGKHSNSRCNS